ncbi:MULTISPECIES: hypothetical protein [unclassified Moorena]|uniref:hypothetical protein n=1 Tax=unclassified Moorena TaxID=2683338 RepID=UPI0014009A6F|nr:MULTISPECIES: hypothetical protein [unclassified Moorena]NEO12710.1 hypothetical protein [Moorena sp. SIO3E8]NEP99486.1 hypothetical protein [Moorena sp. SIO3F7]
MAIASHPHCLDKGGAMATPIVSNDCLGLGTYSNQQRRNSHYSNQRSAYALRARCANSYQLTRYFKSCPNRY